MATFQLLLTLVLYSMVILLFTIAAVADESLLVNLTLLHSAIDQGAVCLDGSPPGYYLDKGYGSGLRSWIIAIDGGGWCDSIQHSRDNAPTRIGTSTKFESQVNFYGILDNQPQANPDFYNWNRVRVRYCDGSSFTGDVEDVAPDTNLHYRGARIFNVIMEDLLMKGMHEAENAILSGTSAGGLATILNCDKFKSLLPNDVRVKCVSDAGFFINGKTIAGDSHIADVFDGVVTLHESAKNLPPPCTSVVERPSLCFFPQNVVPYVQTPLFFINSAYDAWQIKNVLVPKDLDPQNTWDDCKLKISKCTYSQRIIIQGFGVEFLKTFEGLSPSFTRGYFITSCHEHGRIQLRNYGFNATSPRILHKTIAEAVGDWFFERTRIHQYIDSYPYARDCIP